jgi:hypothetical protein
MHANDSPAPRDALDRIEPRAFSLRVVARMFPGLSPRSLRYMVAKGALPARKIGRQHFVEATALAAFVGCDVAKLPRVPR